MMYFRGNPDAEIVVVTDVLNKEELEAAEPLTGNIGQLYDSIIEKVGIQLEAVVYVNGFSLSREYLNRATKQELLDDIKATLFTFLKQSPRKAVVFMGKRVVQSSTLTKGNESLTSVKEKVNYIKEVNAPIVVSTHPYFLSVDPEIMGDVTADFRLVKRLYDGNVEEQVEIVEKIWTHPYEITAFIRRIENKEFKEIAYDNETSGLDENTDDIWCTAFHAGEKDDKGRRICYRFSFYDKLKPLYSEHQLKEIKDRFAELFDAIRDNNVKQWGWHIDFDDWIEDTWLSGRTTVRSKEDGMVMSWVIDNSSPNKLKGNVYRYLGYPKYDEGIVKEFDEIKTRRGRVLKNEDDIKVLELLGVSPETNERTGSKKWPKETDKGAYGYALIDKEILGKYCSYDAVYTYMLCEKFNEIIDKENLRTACDFRHIILNQLYASRRAGMFVSKAKVTKVRKQLVAIRDNAKDDFFKRVGIDYFNLNSSAQLAKVIYGEPTYIPTYDPQDLYTEFRVKDVNEICNVLLKNVYGDYTSVKTAIKEDSFNYKSAQDKLISTFEKFYPELKGRMYTTSIPVYYKGLFIPVLFTKTGLPSVSRIALEILYENLEEHDHIDTLKMLIMYRKAGKLISTFIDGIENKLDNNSILRPRGNAIGTVTGRISVAKPNTQNWPASIRGIVVPRSAKRKFVTWDLSQAEVRVLAALSNDRALMAATEAPGGIHKNIASLIFGVPVSEVTEHQKKISKTGVFGTIYGLTIKSLAIKLGITEEMADDIINNKLFGAFPDAKIWLDVQKKTAGCSPYFVYTPWGTRRTTINILSSDIEERGHIERIATNMPVQGGAGEVTFYFMERIRNMAKQYDWFKDTYMINTTHDSATYETPDLESAQKLVEVCTEAISRKVDVPPLDRVKFDMDINITDCWYGDVNVYKAVDPSTQYFNWNLLRLDNYLDDEEAKEIMELII